MSDFVHCNSCLRLPNSGGLFFVGNCNLCILCQKCVQKTVVPQANVQDAEKPHMCIICKKPGKFHQISGDMPANVMNFFRDPKQLCENFMKQIKQVLDFRNAHRTRLIKVQGEQFKKCAVEFKKLQEETKRSIEREKTARVEVQRYQEQIKTAKRKLEEDELEIARLKELLHQQRNTQHLLTPHRIALMTPKRHRPDLNIPDSGFSSVGTDPNDESVLSDVDKFVNNVATEKSASPIHVDETIVSIPIPSSLPMTTPAMLGIGQARARSRSKQRSVHARRDRADYF